MVSRRRFLVAGAGTLALAACGRGGNDGPAYSLARVFAPEQPAATPLRLPLALADARGVLLDDVPTELRVRTGPLDGDLGDPTTVERHDDGVPRASFPLAATFAEPGEWRIVADTGDGTAEQVISIRPAQQLPAVPEVGDPMVAMPTPTTADARGVDTICTREPVCPLHGVSLDAALGTGQPMALLVATPRFCQTAIICGPVLDLLLEAWTPTG